jgi:Flp pilus assembly protein TadG
MFPPAGQRWRLRLGNARGSMAVEFVIAVPAFLLLLLLVAGGGNWVTDSGQVGGAARDAARTASVARTQADAVQAADSAAQSDLGGLCNGGNLTVNVTFPPTGNFATAADVNVVVHCSVNLQVFSIVGLNAPQPFGGQSIAPLDPFVTRTS